MTEIISDIFSAHVKRPTILTIGSFDGVHLGHGVLVRTVKEHARQKGAASAIVTLNPHPKLVLRPDSPLQLISTLDERLGLLAGLGLDYVVVFPFSQERSRLRAREFVNILREHLNMVELVCGPNFAVGYKREGTIPVLRELGAELGFTVHVVEPRQDTGGLFSSTRIRELIAEGNVTEATRLLGRYPFLHGRVVHGDHRGRKLGYPTANLQVPDKKLLPANGIYAVRVRLGDEWFQGAASVGIRPTFGGGERTIEVYILDFNRDIYNQQLEVHFVERLRDELKFSDVQGLLDQMARDVENTRRILAQTPLPQPLEPSEVGLK